MKPKQPYPVGKLVKLMSRFSLNETQALLVGQYIVIEAQTLFEKWKTNFTAQREEMNNKKSTKIEVTN